MSVETKPNKLVKGLVLDTFHTDVDNTVATYALNSQLEDQEGNHFHYGSEVGTTFIKNIPDTHVVIGHINMERNETVLFTTDGTNSTIGILSRNDDMSYQYEIKVDDTKQTKKLGFKKNIYIRGVYRLLNGCDKVIYFVDGINKDRRINLNQLDSYKLPTTVTSGIIFDNNISAIIYNISTLTGDIKIIRVLSPTNIFTQSNVVANLIRAVNFQSNLSTSSSILGNISFVQKAQASLLTSASVTGNLTIPKTFNASLLATGTTTADLTVGSGVDADAAAFFARVTAAGGTLTATEQTAVNTLVIAMKADGTWTKMKAIYPMVGASAAACAQNLKSSSFTGAFTSGWTFANTGVTTSGNVAFMNTFLTPSISLTGNNNSMGFYTGSNLQETHSDPVNMGVFNSGSQIYVLTKPNSALRTRNYGTVQVEFLTTIMKGFYMTVRKSSTVADLFLNGNLVATGAAGGTPPNIPIYIGGMNLSNTTYSQIQNDYRFVYISDTLTDTEASNFYTAVQSFQTSLNRQV